MEFPLLTEAVVFRGQTFTVRELDSNEFATWADVIRKDRSLRLIEAARLGMVDPKMTVDELRRAPAALTILLGGKVLDLSDATGPKAVPETTSPSETSTD